MSSIVIAGDTSGSVTLQAPAVAGSTVLNLPATSGTIQASGAGYTTNGVAYATSATGLATGSLLTFNGTYLTANGLRISGSDTSNTIYQSTGDFAIATDGAGANISIKSNFGNVLIPSGNLGLGVTPSAWRSTIKATQIGQSGCVYSNTNANAVVVASNDYVDSAGADRYIATGFASIYQQVSGQHQFYTAASGTAGNAISFTQAMTLDASGNLLVGTTSTVLANSFVQIQYSSTSQFGMAIKNTSSTYNGSFINFLNSSGTSAGSIIQNGTTTVSYSTSSDYRLKNTIAPMTGALAKVAQLKPVTYKWNSDGSDGQGFIAHELAEVCPEAVVGEKDAVDADGNPKYQGIDTSFLVATLTAAIQEQQALITTLTERITALERV